MTDIRFQKILWLYVILIAFAAIAAPLPDHSTSLAAAFDAETAAAHPSWQVITLFLGFLVAVVAGLVGLFKYKAWGAPCRSTLRSQAWLLGHSWAPLCPQGSRLH